MEKPGMFFHKKAYLVPKSGVFQLFQVTALEICNPAGEEMQPCLSLLDDSSQLSYVKLADIGNYHVVTRAEADRLRPSDGGSINAG